MKNEELGLDIIHSFIIKCGDCGQQLVEVIVTEGNKAREDRGLKPIRSKFKSTCYKCGGTSFLTDLFYGSIVVGSLKDGIIVECVDVDYEKDDIIQYLETKKV